TPWRGVLPRAVRHWSFFHRLASWRLNMGWGQRQKKTVQNEAKKTAFSPAPAPLLRDMTQKSNPNQTHRRSREATSAPTPSFGIDHSPLKPQAPSLRPQASSPTRELATGNPSPSPFRHSDLVILPFPPDSPAPRPHS